MQTEPRPSHIDEPKPTSGAEAQKYGDDDDDDDDDGDGDVADDDEDEDEHAEHGARGKDSPPVFSGPRLLASVCD